MTTVIEIQTQLQTLIENPEIQTDEVFTFFGQLDLSVQKAFKAYIKRTQIEVNNALDYNYSSDKLIRQKQMELRNKNEKLSVCGLYVCSYAEYMKLFRWIENEYFTHKWYKVFRPQWLLTNFEQVTRGQDYGYGTMLDLAKYDFHFSDELWARKLVHNGALLKDDPHTYYSDYFWLIFTHESNIFWSDKNSDGAWKDTIKILINEGFIARQQVLIKTLQALTLNFNKLENTWFAELFVSLEPSIDEILHLQTDLMQGLNCQHSKPLSIILKLLKSICLEDSFNIDTFLDYSDSLLTNEVKAVVNNTIAIFTTIAGHINKKTNHKKHIAPSTTSLKLLCEHISIGLMVNDEKIQLRVAKFLNQYAQDDLPNLAEKIACYYCEIFSSVQTQLQPLLTAEQLAELTEAYADNDDGYQPVEKRYLREDNQLIISTNFDDQVFFITQAFDNNELYHFDIYLAVMLALVPKINADTIERLAPAMKNALRSMNAESYKIGYIEFFMGKHFLECVQKLLQQYPHTATQKVYDDIAQDDENRREYCFGTNYFKKSFSQLKPKKIQRLFTDRLLLVTTRIDNQQTLPLLSTPTHTNFLIEPQAFLQRLKIYKDIQVDVDIMDFHIAIMRLFWYKSANILQQLVQSELDGEIADILSYLFDESQSLNLNTIKNPKLWLVAVYRKDHTEELQKFMSHYDISSDYLYTSRTSSLFFNAQTTANTIRDYSLPLEDFLQECRAFNINHFALPTTLPNSNIFFDNLWHANKKHQKLYCDINNPLKIEELIKLVTLSPTNPELIFNEICRHHVRGHTSAEEARLLENTIPILLELWQRDFADSCYVYVAGNMLAEKKHGLLASELWIQTVIENNIDNERLGHIMGNLEHNEFAPLKRFTDLINGHLMNISSVHNSELITLISNMIAHMNDTPIKGTKKLLELYCELLTVTQTVLPQMVENKLTQWNETKSLKAIIKKLRKL